MSDVAEFDSFSRFQQFRSRIIRALAAFSLATVLLAAVGCGKPAMPTMVGSGMFHDIGSIRRGMSANEVRNIMGANYKNVMEEGIRGMDGGNFTWIYPEGRVNFGINGVTSIEPN